MAEGRITQVESFGFERIPDASRYARPIDLFRLLFGGCNTFSTSVLGSFPVLVGLSFKAGVCAIVLGVLAGTCILAPMSLFGPRNGTSDPVSSGAHFGIHGRIVGSFLALLTSIAFSRSPYGVPAMRSSAARTTWSACRSTASRSAPRTWCSRCSC